MSVWCQEDTIHWMMFSQSTKGGSHCYQVDSYLVEPLFWLAFHLCTECGESTDPDTSGVGVESIANIVLVLQSGKQGDEKLVHLGCGGWLDSQFLTVGWEADFPLRSTFWE